LWLAGIRTHGLLIRLPVFFQNGAEILEILPDFCSLGEIYPALAKLLRSSTHRVRSGLDAKNYILKWKEEN
jgi:hypothetical protein